MTNGFGLSLNNAIAFASLAGILITIASNGYVGVLISGILIVVRLIYTKLR